MIIHWRGAGILALLFPILGGASGYGLHAVGFSKLAVPCGILVGSMATWWLGWRLNAKVDDPDKEHTLYGIPMQFCALVTAALSVVGFVGILTS